MGWRHTSEAKILTDFFTTKGQGGHANNQRNVRNT